jgi:hypothetical protein
MKRLNRTPLTLDSGHTFYPWHSLTESEKRTNTELTNTLFEFCYEHPDVEITFDMMNRVGLLHLYNFRVEDYNDTHVSKMILSSTGCRCVRG